LSPINRVSPIESGYAVGGTPVKREFESSAKTWAAHSYSYQGSSPGQPQPQPQPLLPMQSLPQPFLHQPPSLGQVNRQFLSSRIDFETNPDTDKFDFTGQNQFTAIFENRKSKELLQIDGGKRTDGLHISMRSGKGLEHQRWRLKKTKGAF
jgi:hypothetical protein